jgi:chaperone modulatory protein CbpM
MSIETADALWLDEHTEITLEELVELSGLPEEILRELVECGVLVPAETGPEQWIFTSACITTVQTAKRLHEGFDLDANALALALTLLERIRELERQLRESRARH